MSRVSPLGTCVLGAMRSGRSRRRRAWPIGARRHQRQRAVGGADIGAVMDPGPIALAARPPRDEIVEPEMAELMSAGRGENHRALRRGGEERAEGFEPAHEPPAPLRRRLPPRAARRHHDERRRNGSRPGGVTRVRAMLGVDGSMKQPGGCAARRRGEHGVAHLAGYMHGGRRGSRSRREEPHARRVAVQTITGPRCPPCCRKARIAAVDTLRRQLGDRDSPPSQPSAPRSPAREGGAASIAYLRFEKHAGVEPIEGELVTGWRRAWPPRPQATPRRRRRRRSRCVRPLPVPSLEPGNGAIDGFVISEYRRRLMTVTNTLISARFPARSGRDDGIDLSPPLDDMTIAAVRRPWLDHLVISSRPGSAADRLMALARRFGKPIESVRLTASTASRR